ncbi:MAG: thioredoxin domain-containing protein [Bacteroidia bacterium]|nr:thioredoxin domain-containing protein [Bacteroidia bacterium]MDW8348226.1 thioredoxin domain-containing protein [Bacteroidia bacterium]
MHTNRLIHETSPYLLQHAHNPVDWYPWGEEALNKAKQEDKPILLSIGYSACHWCHVMERESFEDPEVAAIMNEFFVNIKVDREERPDIDQIYMEAVQAITGNGGWPLNCFLTPDLKPFYGGTYFPPQPYYNRPSWKSVLARVAKVFRERRKEIEEQAEQIFRHISQDTQFLQNEPHQNFNEADLDTIFFALQKRFDTQHGGFGNAPKFPSVQSIKFLLRYYHFKKSKAAINHAVLSLDKMMMGGIYDAIGGGFSRYSTDNQWHVPHFEKMLYDNALLLKAYCEGYQCTHKPEYLQVITETMNYIQREMTNTEGGFYAAQDADSEGIEGKYFVWQYDEVKSLLPNEFELITDYFYLLPEGNWEHGNNVLFRRYSDEQFAEKHALEHQEWQEILKKAKQTLFEHREKRVKPGLDDKILLNWNALMLSAISRVYRLTLNPDYYNMMIKNAEFLCTRYCKGNTLYRTFKNGEAKILATLEDYSYLIEALIDVYETTFKEFYLFKAVDLLEHTFTHFFDPSNNTFYYTSSDQTDILFRQKEFYDNATPSANSTMAHNLLRLGTLLNEPKYKNISRSMLAQIKNAVMQYPTAFGKWATLMTNMVYGMHEIAYFGKMYNGEINILWKDYHPNIICAGNPESDRIALLHHKKGFEDKDTLYYCTNYACYPPLHTYQELKKTYM